jgi:hypothetical protein
LPEVNTAPDPIPRIADILWPETAAEWELRTRLADLTGSTPERAAWELFALRDHALDVMYSLIYEGRNVPRDMTMTILALLEPRVAPVPTPSHVEAWRVSRDTLYTGVMPGQEETRPYAEIWKDWIERVGGCFASAFDCADGGAGVIGAVEYDKAAKHFFPLCKQLPDRWR